MSDNKKYYYLKLKDNFFDLDEIIALESYKNGAFYSTFYLKMLCKSDYYLRGYRYFNNVFFDSHSEYLSKKLRCSLQEVGEALYILVDMRLVEFSEDKIIIRDINIDFKRNRSTKQYKDWRSDVFKRDDFTCQHCNKRGVELNAHHIKPWAEHPEYRFSLDNGLTLCKECHKREHKKNGDANV